MVAVERRQCALARRHDALAPALAAHTDQARGAVHVTAVEPDQLREPETGRVGQLEQRALRAIADTHDGGDDADGPRG